MLINLHNLLHLPVFTKSNTKLGRVYDLNIDIENHCLKSYLVRANIFSRSYLIKPVQIVEITADKIIVEDALIKETEPAQRKNEVKAKPLAEVAMSEEK